MNIYSKGIIVASLACGLSITTAATYANPQQFQSPSITHQQTSDQGQRVEPGSVPVGLSSSDWASIQEQITDGKYRAYRHDDTGFVSANPAHGWNIRYLEDGTTSLTPRDSDANAYRLGLRLNAVGYAQPETLNHPQLISAEGTTLTYQWNDNLREFWINTQNDLEQWFVLEQRPAGADDGQALTLQMNLDSDLDATQTGNSIRFVNQSGTIISYNKLKAWDASGRDLLAHMQLADNQLSLVIDDSQASYPITIDPSFQQQAYLKASNTNAGDAFGVAVAISGDTLVVGADFENSKATGVNGNQSDNTASGAGAAYVFTRSGTTWSQQAYLKASNTETADSFGSAVAISGDTVVIGAFLENGAATGVNGVQNNDGAFRSGAAYVFTRSGTAWSQQAYLKSSNNDVASGDWFGYSVAISDATIVVGARSERSSATGVNGDQSDNSAINAGAAYVFTRSGTAWSQQAYLKASNTDAGDLFGESVTISGDTVVIGATGEDSYTTGVNGDQARDTWPGSTGASYVFTRSGTTWSQQAYLKASNTGTNDVFGKSVAISGDTVVVGAPGESGDAGAAYVFTRSGTAWSQQAFLKASNTQPTDEFGLAVAIAGDTVVVGAPLEDSSATSINGDQFDNLADNAGAAYVFTRSGTAWSQQLYLKASNTNAGDFLGASVALSGDTAVVGANAEASSAKGVNGSQSSNSAAGAGSAYIFLLDVNTSGSTYTVGGNVSGLSGTGLVLRNNGGNPLSISADGSFTFSTPLDDGSAYAVTVSTQPNNPSQTCSTPNGSGTLANVDVTNILVSCVADEERIFSGGFEN